MQNNIFFSIIIPTYNRASFIVRTINSVLGQTYQNFEIIIVDDGSTDNTESIIKNIVSEKIKYLKIKNSERAFARNYGTLHSSGDYITFLDSDDILLPYYFANACESINKYNTPPFLHLGYEILNNDNKLLFKIDQLKNNDIYFLTNGNSLSCMGCFLRSDISRMFLFNEDRNLSGSEDWELWFRVLSHSGIKTDNRISARMFNHENRSVSIALGAEKELVLRKELALKYAFNDKKVQEKYGNYYKKIDAFGDSYISLHLALNGDNKKSIHYLLKFIKRYPLGIFSKRFLVIIKCILLK
jgi:glycosyltransferase involved in cell wall biosynthesis